MKETRDHVSSRPKQSGDGGSNTISYKEPVPAALQLANPQDILRLHYRLKRGEIEDG